MGKNTDSIEEKCYISSIFLKNLKNLALCWLFPAAHGWFSLVVVSGGHFSLWCAGFSLLWFLSWRSVGSKGTGLGSCSMWVQ